MNEEQKFEIIKYDGVPYTIYKYSKLDSTNTFLKQHCSTLADYTVIWAEEQTQGSGRFGRMWKSEPGEDLTFSFLLPLSSLKLKLRQNITQLAALAVVRLLESHGLKPAVKWPNDVLIKGKKICGILCETVEVKKKAYAILGIGLNVNSSKESFVPLDKPATSIRGEMHRRIGRIEVLRDLLENIIKCFNELCQEGFKKIRMEIKKRLTFINERIIVTDGANNLHPGKIIDLNNDGTLLFNCEECDVISLNSGEVSFKG
ncbi:MAG: biotin--[acetyl-CoA-carboxylase] ligase [Candidatus Scalinduaceae bacterium]